ncbi:MAG: hypothetical protein P1U68_06890 [Verrucomicrobiales bacterium]|nr:hypothetical protein [Verrucomicrobiales bacterium]
MSRPLSPQVEALLRCPHTRQPLHFADADKLNAFQGNFPEGAWITADGSRAYPVREGFAILVPDEAEVINSD